MMSQNPYAQPTGFGGPGGFDDAPVAERTSGLAIASLVFSLICCIPGTGAIGVLLGVGAIFGINSSRGRVRGTGLAITGIVLGLIATVLWILGAIGAVQFAQMYQTRFVLPTTSALQAAERGQYDAFRNAFHPSVAGTLTDEQIEDFVNAYQAEVGSFVDVPDSLGGWVSLWGQVGGQGSQQQMQGMPAVATFSSGAAIILIDFHPDWDGSSTGMLRNLAIRKSDGTEIWLIAPGTVRPGRGGAPPPLPNGDDAQDDDAGAP